MTDDRELDRLLGAYFVDGSNELTDRVIAAALDQIDHTEQRRTRRASWRFPTMSMTTRVATAAAIGVLAIGGTLYLNRPGQPALGGPGPTADASASPSQPAVASPSPTPTGTPNPTPTPLLWTSASLDEDWPAPVRGEPAGGAILLPIITTQNVTGICPRDCGISDDPGRYVDPLGDTGSDVYLWVDIRELLVTDSSVTMSLVSNLPPDVDPATQWIAYGVVFDDDVDGIPDWRFGSDNSFGPVSKAGDRAWITNLHTGRTLASTEGCGSRCYYLGETFFHAHFPGLLVFSGEATGGGSVGTSLVNRPFYAWASVIQDGRVVATDFAPDVGWLDTSQKVVTKP